MAHHKDHGNRPATPEERAAILAAAGSLIDNSDEAVEAAAEKNLGATPEERASKIASLKKLTLPYNLIGLVGAFIPFFMGSKDLGSVVFYIVWPLIGFGLMAFNGSLISVFSDPRRSDYPNISVGFLATVFVSMLVMLNNYQVLSYDNFWLPAAILSAVFFVLLFLIDKHGGENHSVAGKVVAYVAIAMVFGSGSVMNLNFASDRSTPQLYQATIIGERTSTSSRGAVSYYITVAPWGPVHDNGELTVDKQVFDATYLGAVVNVDLYPGLFHIPAYAVSTMRGIR